MLGKNRNSPLRTRARASLASSAQNAQVILAMRHLQAS